MGSPGREDETGTGDSRVRLLYSARHFSLLQTFSLQESQKLSTGGTLGRPSPSIIRLPPVLVRDGVSVGWGGV